MTGQLNLFLVGLEGKWVAVTEGWRPVCAAGSLKDLRSEVGKLPDPYAYSDLRAVHVD